MTHASDINEVKQRVRTLARTARAAIELPLRVSLSAEACRLLLGLAEVQSAQVALAYAASAEEIDPAVAVARMRELGKSVAMPRMEGPGELAACLASDEELEAGPFGIKQPCADAPALEVEELDVVIVPGVAFDTNGRRIGYGGGYYDRLLPRLTRECFSVGLAFDQQVFDELPVADHDQLIDALVTPTRVLRFKPRQ